MLETNVAYKQVTDANDMAVSSDLPGNDFRLAARAMSEARRDLRSKLPPEFASDAPLDILLHLFLAEDHVSERDVLLKTASAFPTVAERWIVHLEKSGYIATDGEAVFMGKRGCDVVVDACKTVIGAVARSRLSPES